MKSLLVMSGDGLVVKLIRSAKCRGRYSATLTPSDSCSLEAYNQLHTNVNRTHVYTPAILSSTKLEFELNYYFTSTKLKIEIGSVFFRIKIELKIKCLTTEPGSLPIFGRGAVEQNTEC